MNTTQLRKSYPNHFEGIGNFDGQFHITTDRNVTPEVHAPRKCPIHMRDEIKSELENMESLGVIKRVTQPTDWVSSIVYSRKSSGQLRISLNLTDLNKAVKHPHYKTPILNEVITAADRTAKRRSGTWQIKTRSVPQITIEALNNRIHQICQIKRYRCGQSSSALHAQDADPGWNIFQIVEKCLHCEFRHMDGFPFTRRQVSLAQPTFELLLKTRPSTDLSRADCGLSTTTSFGTEDFAAAELTEEACPVVRDIDQVDADKQLSAVQRIGCCVM